MSKEDPEGAYYKGKVEGQKNKRSTIVDCLTLSAHSTPTPGMSKTERELWRKGVEDGKKNR